MIGMDSNLSWKGINIMKLIFFDIDGTLVSDNQLIPESARTAINKARENGHICVINTGRAKYLVGPELTEQVEFDGYLMGCGTMAVYHDELLMHHTFSDELSGRIMDAVKRYEIDCILEGCENNYCEDPENLRTETFRMYIEHCTKNLGDFYTKFELGAGRFDKLFIFEDNKAKLDAFRGEFEKELDFIDREHGFYEIVPKGFSKATAIHFLADKLNISLEDTVAIGDSNNDLPMLEVAGTSIAMGNSSKAVLEMADYVTTDVDKDGIRNALQWLGVLDA